ncbi:hypothetical protein LCGC14_2152140 [marine sediment metagenome]|uniref:Uncharacterized protein n=1 Tax=marine sediment metagenome TaxID=412755 RepID=A0A0F9GRK4_9ZZZZ
MRLKHPNLQDLYDEMEREADMADKEKIAEYAKLLVHRKVKESQRRATVDHVGLANDGVSYEVRQQVEKVAETHKLDAEAWAWVDRVITEAATKERQEWA